MKYTVSVATLKAVAQLRELQVMRQADAYRKDLGKVPTGLLDTRNVAAVHWQNGTPEARQGVLPVALIAKWAALVPHPELNLEITDEGIRLYFGMHENGATFWFKTEGAIDVNHFPILLETGAGTEFRLGASADPAEAMKAEKKRLQLETRREQVKKKMDAARSLACGIHKTATAAAKQWKRAQALLTVAGPFAVAQAKRLRDAGRLYRRTLAAPDEIPAWANVDETRTLTQRNHAVREALQACIAYKPRVTKWGQKVYGPKHEKLRKELKARENRRNDSLKIAVARHLKSTGLHLGSWYELQWMFHRRRGSISLARRTVRAWPRLRVGLATEFNEAWHSYRELKARYEGLAVSRDVNDY